jgi:hypothetical protein
LAVPEKPQRFDLPTDGSLIGAFRALREFIAAEARAKGRELDPAWYLDGPEHMPDLYPQLIQEKQDEPHDAT